MPKKRTTKKRTIEFERKNAHAMRKGRSLERQAMQIRNIILHSSDGRKAGDLATLTGEDVSAHWYVTRAGEIFHLVDDEDTAFHAGQVTKPRFFGNAATIGIEQEHFDPDPQAGRPQNEDWPETQIKTVAELVAFLLQEHGLNSPDDIKTHAEVAFPPGRKQDPFGYPFDHFFSLVADNRQFTWSAKAVSAVAPAAAAVAKVPAPENPVLTSALFHGNAILEAVAEGHLVLQASGGKVDGIGPVQDALNTLGFPINLGSANQFRGFFGEKTQAALSAFQQATPGILEPTGVVDQDTIKALDAALMKHRMKRKLPATQRGIKLLSKGKVVATLKEKPGGSGPLRPVDVMQFPGRVGFYYKAAMAIDVDGSPRAYTKDATSPKPLDSLESVDSEGIETMYIQQRSKTVHGVTHVGEGPFKDFFVSRTSLLFNKNDAFKTSNFVDAELIPYIVFPHNQGEPPVFSGVSLGDVAYVIDLKTRRFTHAIFADTNPKVGEASVRVALNLGRSDLNAGNGEEADRFLYILFPGSKFDPEPTVPHWPDAKIKQVADKAFAAWGGMDQVRKLFPTA
jgi:N-acetyl-anhydromuramyl-L-alanine amidase AmpD